MHHPTNITQHGKHFPFLPENSVLQDCPEGMESYLYCSQNLLIIYLFPGSGAVDFHFCRTMQDDRDRKGSLSCIQLHSVVPVLLRLHTMHMQWTFLVNSQVNSKDRVGQGIYHLYNINAYMHYFIYIYSHLHSGCCNKVPYIR